MSAADGTKGRWDTAFHAPVLLAEVLDALAGARRVLDGTLGGGGHSAALVERGAAVVALDRDPDAIVAARQRLASVAAEGRFSAMHGNFADPAALDAAGSRFDGILLDLGISSHQIDDERRGFTFREGAPLDMRMGADAPHDAAHLLNHASVEELARIFREYGDEPRARRLAKEIERRRLAAPLTTSDDLVKSIRGALGARTGPSDFARLFQAVRIAVNEELSGLGAALPVLRDRLRPGGRFAVISYHSGEDRIVKHAFRDWSTACHCPPRQPVCTCGGRARGRLLQRKAIVPSQEERARNPRSRSARLRVWIRED